MFNFFREIMLTLLNAETAGKAGQKSLGNFSAAIGRWGKSGRGLPQSKTLRDRRRPWERSARFWTAPVLWRFGVRTSERRGDDQTVVTAPRWKSGRGLPQSKTLRDSRRRGESSARFWTAPAL